MVRSPLDDVPSPPSRAVENASLRVLMQACVVLLILVVLYLAILPNRPAPSFSTLTWAEVPRYSIENPAQNTGRIIFSVYLSSFEVSDTSYRVNVQFEGKTVATQNVSLASTSSRKIDFSIPVKGNLDEQNQILVSVTKPSVRADENASQNDIPLELVGYFAG